MSLSLSQKAANLKPSATLAVGALAKEMNWRAAGLVDFDVLDGVDEFLAAAKRMGVRAVAGALDFASFGSVDDMYSTYEVCSIPYFVWQKWDQQERD